MRELIGDNWKSLVGAEQEVLKPGSSPGFDHSVYWSSVLYRLDALKTGDGNQNQGSVDDKNNNNSAQYSEAEAEVCTSSVLTQ